MQKIELKSFECAICFNQFKDPWIHDACGRTMDQQCILNSIQQLGRCPSCNLEATMEQFKPNVRLRDAMEELQRLIPPSVAEIKAEKPAPPPPTPSFSLSVSAADKESFSRSMEALEARDTALCHSHIGKDTKELRVDWANGYVGVFKSGNRLTMQLQPYLHPRANVHLLFNPRQIAFTQLTPERGNWYFYKIGNGAGIELCKTKTFEEGVAFIFHGRC
ncbi:MAG: hypothetical protein QNJ27_02115 [Simkaniaceae bacterium]|nr:hypothetical protein [Simkaniaceae bacterium]